MIYAILFILFWALLIVVVPVWVDLKFLNNKELKMYIQHKKICKLLRKLHKKNGEIKVTYQGELIKLDDLRVYMYNRSSYIFSKVSGLPVGATYEDGEALINFIKMVRDNAVEDGKVSEDLKNLREFFSIGGEEKYGA